MNPTHVSRELVRPRKPLGAVWRRAGKGSLAGVRADVCLEMVAAGEAALAVRAAEGPFSSVVPDVTLQLVAACEPAQALGESARVLLSGDVQCALVVGRGRQVVALGALRKHGGGGANCLLRVHKVSGLSCGTVERRRRRGHVERRRRGHVECVARRRRHGVHAVLLVVVLLAEWVLAHDGEAHARRVEPSRVG